MKLLKTTALFKRWFYSIIASVETMNYLTSFKQQIIFNL